MAWRTLPLSSEVLQNVDETALRLNSATLENAYVNDVGGHTRFPGLRQVLDLQVGTVYLGEWRGDMAAVANGRMYRVGRDLQPVEIPGVPVSGGRRVMFAKTEDELLMVAGGKIIKFAGTESIVLSADAPETTHIGFIAGYVVALEKESQRFLHSEVGEYNVWDPLSVLTAEYKSDILHALAVSETQELILAGPESIEVHEPFASGTQPFFRRWTAPDGLRAPYTLISTDQGSFGVNRYNEFVQFASQRSAGASDSIQSTLSGVTDWSDAWAKDIRFQGQQFILLQAPKAVTPYGTKGLTVLLSLKNRRWSFLYGWDQGQMLPTRWPGRSHIYLWDRHFVGGDDGKIYELDVNTFNNGGLVQRMLGRTAHYEEGGTRIEFKGLRIRMKRGALDPNVTAEPLFSIRVNKDNQGFGRWIRVGLGRAGAREMTLNLGPLGIADTWQLEYAVTDEAPVELVKIEADIVAVS